MGIDRLARPVRSIPFEIEGTLRREPVICEGDPVVLGLLGGDERVARLLRQVTGNKFAAFRAVDRAKCLLIECCSMTEPEAHAYIEQQAMKRRVTKREIAEAIIGGETPG